MMNTGLQHLLIDAIFVADVDYKKYHPPENYSYPKMGLKSG